MGSNSSAEMNEPSAPPVSLWALLLFVEKAGHPYGDDKNNDANDTEFAELVTSQQPNDRQPCERKKPCECAYI